MLTFLSLLGPLAAAEDADMDTTALRDFGVEDFSSMLRWAMRQEAAAAAAASRRRRGPNWGRKKARLRARRLVGQGLDPAEYERRGRRGQAKPAADISWIPELKPEDLKQR